MKNLFYGFALAFSMLTTLPFFKVHNFFKGINGYAVMFYPLVGFILGNILYVTHLLLTPYLPSIHLNIIIFVLSVVLTGALHLDGVADTFDALFVSKERAKEVMKDPHIGAMGMIFAVTFLIFKASTFVALEAYYLLPFVMMLSRFNATLAIYFFKYTRENGMSSLAKKEFTHKHLLASSFMVAGVSLFFNFYLLALSLLILLTFKLWAYRRFGGFSGDLYGFMIELSELLLLNAIVVLT